MLLRLTLLAVASLPFARADIERVKEKYDYLEAETLNNPHGVVLLEEKELAKYVFEFPRDYDVFVFLTMQNCQYCKVIEQPFLEVAQAYKAAQTYLPKRVPGKGVLRPVFFLMAYTSYANTLFTGNFRLKSFPNIYYSSVEDLFIQDEWEKQNYMDVHFWRITVSDVRIDSHKIIEWTRRNRPDQVALPRSFLGFLKMAVLMFAVLGLVACLFIYAEKVVLNEKVWLVGSLVVFMISAGGMYSAIHQGSPFVGVKREGIELIMTGTRNQFVAEGFVITGAFLLIGGCLVALTYVMKMEFKSLIVKYVCFFALLQVAIMVLLWVEDVFRGKNFYNPIFFPPSYYIRGGYYKDQGIIQ